MVKVVRPIMVKKRTHDRFIRELGLLRLDLAFVVCGPHMKYIRVMGVILTESNSLRGH